MAGMNISDIIYHIQKHARKSLLLFSLIILLTDIAFVTLNYHSANKALLSTLSKRALDHKNEFGISMQMTYANMMQMAQFISNDKKLNQLFLKGKKSVEASGNPCGDALAAQARAELLQEVKPAWDNLTAEFNVRQLHYHLGPGSLSFLRVHAPHKFGDRMDNLRYTIVDTNAEKTPRTGFETGRIYGGLRAVAPVWAEDNGRKTFVGALEVGTSFDLLLPMFARFYKVDSAVLLTRTHIESRMWDEYIEKFFSNNPRMDYYLESISAPELRPLIPDILRLSTIDPSFSTSHAQLFEYAGRYISAFYFPLRDYSGEKDPSLPPAGFVMLWEDVTPMVTELHTSVWINIIYALLGFVIIEVILVWLFNRELRLATAEHEATRDGLTGLYNRRFFDKTIQCEMTSSERTGREVSILVCDIDHFKHYNDTYGHQQGDSCLQQVAACLQRNLSRNIDWIARYGGEEFVVILPDTNREGAAHVAERLRQAVMDLGLQHEISGTDAVVTLSIGVASSAEAGGARELFECADQKLYRAKELGRNRVEA